MIDDAKLQGEAGGVSAVFGAEFLHDMGDVQFYGVIADVEVSGDFLIGVPPHQLGNDFDFAWSEFGAPESVGQSRGNGSRKCGFSSTCSHDGLDEFRAAGRLREIANGTRMNRLKDGFFRLEGRKHKDPSGWVFFAELFDDLAAIHIGKPPVHDHEVRTMLFVEWQHFGSAFGFSHDFNLGFKIEGSGEAETDHVVVIYKQDPDSGRHGSRVGLGMVILMEVPGE
jgi:hypothetical protein